MPKRCQYCPEEKLAIFHEVETGQMSQKNVAEKYHISLRTLQEWLRLYRLFGLESLENRTHNTSYPEELKLQAVQDYLSGNYSQSEIRDKYKLSDRKRLRDWIIKYNSHSEFKSSNNGGARAMTKGRATNWKERIDIVLYCMSHNYNYQHTAETYQVSYQQVYQWVKKYQDGGEDALKDGRGRKKALEELSESDRQKLALKKLEYENERLRAENAFLKKLQELEGGWS